MPLVSVIIPNYNHAKFLNQRIDSVLNQTFQDFELLILDDNSPDNSKEIIEQYRSHPKVSNIVYNTQNSGSTFKQWNKGISLAKGEYIWIAESDDWSDKQFLEKLLAIANQSDRIGVVFSNTYYVDNEGNKIHNPYLGDPTLPEEAKYLNDFVQNGLLYCKEQLLGPIIGNASSAIFKKKYFEKIGGADESMKLAGDWKMWHQLLLHCDIGYCADKMNYFRHHAVNVRSTKGAQYFLYETAKISFELMKSLNLTKTESGAIKEQLFRQWVFWMGKRFKEIPNKIKIRILMLYLKHDSIFLLRLIKWPVEKIF